MQKVSQPREGKVKEEAFQKGFYSDLTVIFSGFHRRPSHRPTGKCQELNLELFPTKHALYCNTVECMGVHSQGLNQPGTDFFSILEWIDILPTLVRKENSH